MPFDQKPKYIAGRGFGLASCFSSTFSRGFPKGGDPLPKPRRAYCTPRGMTILSLVLTLLIIGVLLWGLSQFPAIDPTIKKVIYVVVIVAVLLWLLASLGGEGHVWNRRLWS